MNKIVEDYSKEFVNVACEVEEYASVVEEFAAFEKLAFAFEEWWREKLEA